MSGGTLLLTGTVGAGTTTTAAAIADLLGERGVPHGVLDLDRRRREPVEDAVVDVGDDLPAVVAARVLAAAGRTGRDGDPSATPG